MLIILIVVTAATATADAFFPQKFCTQSEWIQDKSNQTEWKEEQTKNKAH